ncbi:MAG: hypothetical protein JJU45_08060 [Acidimicrobiia bacterium]|nr:hypothetical protein [Acidimicrobiia bacterium]
MAVAAALLRGSPFVADIDPRRLTATQPWVLRHHVTYYLTPTWHTTGLTSADRATLSNRYPLVAAVDDRLILLGGHHRAMAALLAGQPLRARVAADASAAIAVLPRLLVGSTWPGPHLTTADPQDASRALHSGTVTVPDLDTASATLHAAGFDAARIADRMSVAAGRPHRLLD